LGSNSHGLAPPTPEDLAAADELRSRLEKLALETEFHLQVRCSLVKEGKLNLGKDPIDPAFVQRRVPAVLSVAPDNSARFERLLLEIAKLYRMYGGGRSNLTLAVELHGAANARSSFSFYCIGIPAQPSA
jgi:hypothetical protein